MVETYQVGARFEALIAHSVSPCILITIQTLKMEQCEAEQAQTFKTQNSNASYFTNCTQKTVLTTKTTLTHKRTKNILNNRNTQNVKKYI